MNPAPWQHLFAAIIFALLSAAGSDRAQATIPAYERQALLALYASTNGGSWTQDTGWNGPVGSECNWRGVTCDAGGDSVRSIDLSDNNLTGTLPGSLALPLLDTFYVQRNRLTGSIPSLSAHPLLAAFVAGQNQLSGSIPEINSFGRLRDFEVGNNRLSGPIPPLAGLVNLATFEASNNALTGPIPALTGLPNLVIFDVLNNQLTGPIPALTGLSNLTVFALTNNHLTGSIPSLAGLGRLQIFAVDLNQLTGDVPAVPSPNNLALFHASLCPNLLNPAPSPEWDFAVYQSYQTPWYSRCAAAPANANFQGLWWVPHGAESGWGLNFAHQGDQIFTTWYTYDTSGKPWWLSMLAARTIPSGNAYAGAIHADSGPPFNDFVGTHTPVEVGNGTLTFSDGDNGLFAYAVNGVHQTKQIARFDLGTGPQPTCVYTSGAPNFAAATNYQDLWWAAGGAEPGWGVNLAHQDGRVFATWYTYNVDHTPLWLTALAAREGTGNVFAGPIYQTSGPRFDAYDMTSVVATPVGTATFTFADGNDATFAYTVMVAPFPGLVTQSKQIARFPFAASGGTVCH